MTRSMLLVGIAVVPGAAGAMGVAQEPRPEEIIDKAIRAHGGEEKLAGLSALPSRSGWFYPDAAAWATTQIVVRVSRAAIAPRGRSARGASRVHG